ncbi:MAG: hypothetical protein MJ149_01280 [Clostridia bacterium]|nr:hypothetical protein [Clostridia bacterium]
MENLSEKVNYYISTELLNVDNLPKELNTTMIDRLFSKKYRKYSIDPNVKINVENKLNNIIENKLPLNFIPSFGGYKHWWTPTYPEIDWAEIFNMKFMLEYLSPIFYNYKDNKTTIEYESEEIILSELNNVPQSGLDRYTQTFRQACNFFNEKLNGLTQLKLSLAREQYLNYNFDKEKLLKRIDEIMPAYTDRFNSYDKEDQERRILKAKTNFKLNGVKDYTNLNDNQQYELFKWSRIFDEAFLDADFEVRGNDFFEKETNIPLLFSFGLGPGGESWLHIGSSKSSMVDFWAGIGILEIRQDGKIVERILSRSQYESVKNELIKVSVDSPLSAISKNFNYIFVYEGELKF